MSISSIFDENKEAISRQYLSLKVKQYISPSTLILFDQAALATGYNRRKRITVYEMNLKIFSYSPSESAIIDIQ